MSRRASSHLHQHAKVKGRPLSASGRDFKRGRNKAERGEPYDRPADKPRTGQWRLTEHPELIFHLHWPPLYTRTEDPDWNRVFKLLQREERRLLGLNACLAGLSCNKVSHIKDTWMVNTGTIERRGRKKKSHPCWLCVFSLQWACFAFVSKIAVVIIGLMDVLFLAVVSNFFPSLTVMNVKWFLPA